MADNEEYWFITYSWVGNDGHRVLENDMWSGRMINWILNSFNEPENWILINQIIHSMSQKIGY